MNERQIYIVQRLFDKLAPRMPEIAALFYENLFQWHPELRLLFKGDVQAQKDKFSQVLLVLIKGLNEPRYIKKELKKIGEKHIEYGVQSSHYDLTGAVFLNTIKEFVGEDYTEELDDAMIELYNFISTNMSEEHN